MKKGNTGEIWLWQISVSRFMVYRQQIWAAGAAFGIEFNGLGGWRSPY